MVIPLNKAIGNIPYPYVVLAGEVLGPMNFNFNLGIAASANGVGIPLGIFFGPARFYIGTGDILSLVGKNKNLSLVVGVFHFDI